MTNICTTVSVALEGTTYGYDKLFDYAVPAALYSKIQPGMRVTVPFGAGNKSRIGMIMSLNNIAEQDKKLKSLLSLLDDKPLLNNEMLALAVFLSDRCFCTLYDCIRIMLPAGIGYRLHSCLIAADRPPEVILDELQDNVFYTIAHSKKPVSIAELTEIFGTEASNTVDFLLSNGFVKIIDNPVRKVNDATVKSVRLLDSASDSAKLTPKQRAVYDTLAACGSASVKEICYFTGVTTAVIDGLVKKGDAEYFEEEVFRIPKDGQTLKHDSNIVLSDEQNKAFECLKQKYKSGNASAALLYGVTGSGKTSVFTSLIDEVRADGKGVIVMVPEIALTPQLIGAYRSRYGDDIAVFHSALSMGERLDEWKRVKQGKAKIAIGTRSAVFAPLDDIGLIIIDEEQEYTYKSESTPRFHARDAAKFRCSKHNALLLLSSATPSIESMYNAQIGRYTLCTLKNRYGNATLPKTIITDMNTELENGNRTSFSNILLESLEENLNTGKQSIILLNRRGHNTYVSCKSCGKIIDCPNCSISLTYHSANNRLMCHYCGYSVKYDSICPECGAKTLRLSGTGTQRAELDLAEIFPDASILRLDADSTLKKNSHETKLKAFSDGKYDILLGTQMVAKGLDFPNVTLVGVLSADQMLYGDDFRCYERAFSLLTQVVGRSGRGGDKGIAIVQTFTPENPVISLAAQQDYDKFYESEINIRRAMLYPPFSDICVISFAGINDIKTCSASEEFAVMLSSVAKEQYSELPLRILKPSPSGVLKINGKFRYKIILKFRNSLKFREMLSKLLKDTSKNKSFKEVSVFADINPDSVF